MILFRYLTREILQTMAAVAGVLLLVIMGSRFIRYFSSAAEGDIPVSILGNLMLYHLPGFLELILPLAFFLGILLAYGQLYLNSEITVLVACGTSPVKLLQVSMVSSVIVVVLVGLCSLWLTPAGALHNELLIEEQRGRLDFSSLTPGRFQDFGDGRTVYIEALDENDALMEEVFISERQRRSDGSPETMVTRAASGYQVTDDAAGTRFLVLGDGERFSIEPGQNQAERLVFDSYAVRLTGTILDPDLAIAEYATTDRLLTSSQPAFQAQLQWRLSLPLMVVVLTVMAMPLSKVNPRQGRFAKLLPAVFLYVAYLSLLLATLDAIGSGSWPVAVGMWPIHGVFLALGLGLLWRDQRRGMSG